MAEEHQQNYQHDIFISYRREGDAYHWVHNHFYPLLKNKLTNILPHKPNIFRDIDEIDPGDPWPQKIKDALLKSKCLVTVWTTDYFRSEWCCFEWRSMLKREELLRSKLNNNNLKLIYPIKLYDGKFYPDEAKKIQQKDLTKLNYSHIVFKNSLEYLELEKEVYHIAEYLSDLIMEAPDWEENWPIVNDPGISEKVTNQALPFKIY